MEYPKHLYKSPGPHRRSAGRTFAYIGVADEDEERERIAEGWCLTFDELYADTAAEIIEQAEALQEAIDEITPPTREELETKARELKVSFNARTSDETLVSRIAEALD